MDMPEPPDPYESANAQFGANMDAAIAGSLINNYNENSPFGTVRYTEGAPRSFTDSQGNRVSVPNLTRNVALDPSQQAILDQQNAASLNLATLAAKQSSMLSDYLGMPFDPNYEYSYDYTGVTPDQREWVQYTPEQIAAMSTPASGGSFTPGTFTPSMTYDQWVNDMYAQDQRARLTDRSGASHAFTPTQAQYEQAINAEKRNWEQQQLSQMLAAGGTGSGGSAYSGPGGYWKVTPGQGPTLTRQEREQPLSQWAYAASAPELATTFADVGDITRSYGPTDYSEDRQRVESAWMDRVNRLTADQRDAFEAQMRAQGLTPGAEYYDDQYRTKIADPYNDAVNQAIVMGGQEQSRLAELTAARAAFENAAQQQAYQQAQGRGMFSNSALLEQYATQQAAADAQNRTRQQQFQEALAMRNQPINEITALMSGSQVQVPQFTAPYQQGISPAPIADLIQQQYEAQAANAQAGAQGMFGLLGNLVPLIPR